MNNFIIVIGSIIFLALLWILTYRNLLSHLLAQISVFDKEMRGKFFTLFSKLPYLFQTMGEHKVQCGDMLHLRGLLVRSDIGVHEIFENYTKLYTQIEEISGAHDKSLKSDIGFLEIKKEMENLHDEIRLISKAYDEKAEEFNSKLLKFPGNFVGGLFRMQRATQLAEGLSCEIKSEATINK